MTLNEVYCLAIKETGQYVTDDIEFRLSDFKLVFEKHIIPLIGRHRPVRKVKSLYLAQSPYIFTEEEGIPDWVSDVGILMTLNPASIVAVIPQMFRQENRSRLWLYDRPYLWTFMFGQLSVQCCYFPKLERVDEGDIETKLPGFGEDMIGNDPMGGMESEVWNIVDLDPMAVPHVINLATGFMLKSIGGARKAINWSDWPITSDAADLVAKGEELIKSTMDELTRKAAWWLAV